MTQILAGPDCTTMAEVRAGVDQLDRELVAMLARRFAYMDAAARIKPTRDRVRDEDRKAQVIEQARAEAQRLGVPETVVVEMWETLVEGSIAYELAAFDRRD
ncbi:chorismate mutase type II family protein [Sphingomonas sp. S17]|jgi:isochorismate pyruvate lyase|uniref:chorismate mutase n=2 Tax=Sphingomonas paucimobilis TaxID=13689 RepID=A0A411LJN9_SPHPI|nr:MULTISPECIES: chorismate mutase [Sphingomonas]EGI56514.1 chorismate mutase type II family protein [Sphingomonas sp. S17]MBQ1479141.1 chorismate mutase [Sphingomonas sp.]MCM3678635.1 chorismate mutase [Sphingomonas paucimobilis]MDG5969661.1 chorismate mutase [Sphingomonas paucimobilis]NNG59574.1 chorismate mutase [Sphingomonas paucimobilis]